MRAFFIRHGETDYNVKGLCNAEPGVPVTLTKLGKSQIEKASADLAGENVEVIFVSELSRTLETAEILNRFQDARIVVDARIGDRITGFEGQSALEFRRALDGNRIAGKVNGGESFLEEKDRVCSFLKDLEGAGYDTVLIVSHDEPLRIMHGYFSGLTDDEVLDMDIKTGEIFFFDITTQDNMSPFFSEKKAKGSDSSSVK